MIEVKKVIDKLNKVIETNEEERVIDLNDLIECVGMLNDLSEGQDAHRNEVIATGNVYEINYIHHKDKETGLIKFLFEKMKRAKSGDAIRGRIACVMEETRLNTDLREGDRVKIWADFSPYEIHREDGMTFHKLKLWVDKLERIDRGISNWTPRKEVVAG